jgi:hypothetical protein
LGISQQLLLKTPLRFVNKIHKLGKRGKLGIFSWDGRILPRGEEKKRDNLLVKEEEIIPRIPPPAKMTYKVRVLVTGKFMGNILRPN